MNKQANNILLVIQLYRLNHNATTAITFISGDFRLIIESYP